jgi:hypothetical protein
MKMEKRIRALLREKANEDGLTIPEIALAMGLYPPPSTISTALKTAMVDSYIDRYKRSEGGEQLSAVWCVVVPNENCPKPDKGAKQARDAA